MKFGKWLIALSVLCLPLVSHADTFAGSASFADTSSANNNDFNFSGSFANPSFSFTGGAGTIYNDALTINTNFVVGKDSHNDSLSVTINFTDPNDATAGFTGTGVTFYGFLSSSSVIDWTTTSQIVDFGDGSSLLVSLPDFDFDTTLFGSYGSTEDVSMKVLTSGTTVTPEPSSLTLLGTGLLCLAGLIFYRKRLPISGVRPAQLTSAV